MSFVPIFQAGIWNAWILTLTFLLVRIVFSGRVTQKTEGKINTCISGMLYLLFIYSIFVPLPLGTAWFYIGIAILMLGTVLFVIAGLSWANNSPQEPVTKGLYRYSRHPYYVTMLIQLTGIGIASASWIFLLLSLVLIVPLNYLMRREEAFCLKVYGDTYREYMNRTPRWARISKLKV